MKIVTLAALKKEMQKYLLLTAETDKVVSDKAVLRLVAAQHAHELSDMGRRDTINLFVDGIKPVSKRSVREWLEVAEECAEGVDDDRPNWLDLFEDFYGPMTLESVMKEA